MNLSKYNKTLGFYLRQLKPYSFLLFLVVLIILLTESISVGIRYIFKLFIDVSQEFLSEAISQTVYKSEVFFLIILVIIGLVLMFAFWWLRYHIGNKVIVKTGKTAKLDVLKHLFTLDYKFFSDTKSGSLVTKFTRIERSMQGITEALFISMLPAFFQILISLVAIFHIHYSYTILIIVALIMTSIVNIWLQKKQLRSQEVLNDAEEDENALVADTFSNVETVKLYAKEEYIHSRFSNKAEHTKESRLDWENYYRWFDSFNNSFPWLVVACLLLLSGMLLIDSSITIGDIFFVESTFLLLSQYMRFVLFMFRSLYTGIVDLDSIVSYLQRKPLIKDKKNAKDLVVRKGHISFSDISFAYTAHQHAIDQVSIDIPSKTSVAFVGRSGSGKSTLVKLLCRFYDVKSGSIAIDNQDIFQVTQKSLRESLSFVAQEGILFDDTIYNNILFPNPTASKEDVFAAIKAAQLDDVINKLPKKEHTLVGERGVKLSGGERQRVSVARAILANRPIVILDEATSALDSMTEQKIQTALKRLLENKTSIIIAHRLSTIMHVDNIVVCSNGKVVEQGTHKELIKKKGEYYNLWKMQKDGFIE